MAFTLMIPYIGICPMTSAPDINDICSCVIWANDVGSNAAFLVIFVCGVTFSTQIGILNQVLLVVFSFWYKCHLSKSQSAKNKFNMKKWAKKQLPMRMTKSKKTPFTKKPFQIRIWFCNCCRKYFIWYSILSFFINLYSQCYLSLEFYEHTYQFLLNNI